MSNLKDVPVPFAVTNQKLNRRLSMRAHKKLWEAGIYGTDGFWDAIRNDEMFQKVIESPDWAEAIGLHSEEDYRMSQLFFALFFVSETFMIFDDTHYLDDLRMNFAADTIIV